MARNGCVLFKRELDLDRNGETFHVLQEGEKTCNPLLAVGVATTSLCSRYIREAYWKWKVKFNVTFSSQVCWIIPSIFITKNIVHVLANWNFLLSSGN